MKILKIFIESALEIEKSIKFINVKLFLALIKVHQKIKLPIFSESTLRADSKNIYIVKKIF